MKDKWTSVKRIVSIIAVIIMPILAVWLIFFGINFFVYASNTTVDVNEPNGFPEFMLYLIEMIGIGSLVIAIIPIIIFIICLRYLIKNSKVVR